MTHDPLGAVPQVRQVRTADPDRPHGQLLADLASVGVFRTAGRELGGAWAVKSLDLSLQLTGVAPTAWTLLSIATPPIHEGGAIAHATLSDMDGTPVATVERQVVVQPLT